MRLRCFAIASFAAASSLLFAQDIPLTNWTVPPYRASSSSGGLTTMTDISPGVGFVAVQPCRVVDTRGGGVFTGTYGPPIMAANAQRSFDINSAPHCPGIPAGVDAYSLNFTATQTVGAPGDIRSWPTGNPPVQVTSVLNWTVGNATVANATIIPAGTNGFIDVYVAGTATHLLIDINGYFTDQYNGGVSFRAVSSNIAPAILGENTSQVNDAVAIRGVITSTNPGANAVAVQGINNSTSDKGIGVFGVHNGSAYGVLGYTQTGVGVFGSALAATGAGKGVYGQTASSSFGTAGVFGVDGSGPTAAVSVFPAGVRGESKDWTGVLGLTQSYRGVVGGLVDAAGSQLVSGVLGFEGGATDYGVFSFGPYGGSGSSALVVEPHPMRADAVIRHSALTGSESGTYFRGRGKFQNGLATIDVPEDFRLVTDPEGLGVVATPIGSMATISVASVGLQRIVLRGSRDVEFFYIVNGVRKSHKHLTAIGPGREYIPESEDSKMPLWLTEGQKEMLISNGTYNPGGTVNMETARRLGWDKEWKNRERPTPQPAAD